MSQIGQEQHYKVIQVFQQQDVITEEVDLIEYEPEEGEGGEVVYELVELAQPSVEIKTGLYDKSINDNKFRCANRVCKRRNIVYDTKEELDVHNEVHIEQYRNAICPICNKELANSAKLEVHIELRHTPRHFTCDQCGKVFRSKDNLRLHMSHHRKYFHVECKACGRGYKSIQSLRYHLRQHFEHHQCETCGKVFEHKKLLLGHVAAMHNQDLQVHCRYCTRTFARSDVRDAHERDIHKNGAVTSHFKCNECTESFDLRDDLMSHKILNHFSGVIHTCEECGKNFKKKSLLDLHMNVHRKKSISCDVCKQMFTFITGLNKHKKLGRCKGPPSESLADVLTKEEIARIAKAQLQEITVNPKKDVEEEEETFEPEITIKKEFTVKKKAGRKPKVEKIEISKVTEEPMEVYEVEEIQPIVTSSSGRIIKRKLPNVLPQLPYRPNNFQKRTNVSFMCDICGIKMETKANLTSHLLTHYKEKSQKCQHCDESFPNMHALKQHCAREHQINENSSKEKRFECDQCGKRYITAHLLGIHKKSHENLREFKCTHEGCRFATNSPYDLKTHIKRMHNATKPFECPLCNKKFKRRCDMLYHKDSIHCDVKTYVKCPVCAKIILERGLQSHMINRHSEKAQIKPFECSICGKKERYERALQRHYDAVHEPKDRGVSYQCPECPATFYRRRDMSAHSFEHYTGEIFECSTCGNKYKSKKELTNHEYSHRVVEYPCNICNKIFQTKSGRGKHMRKHFSKKDYPTTEDDDVETVIDDNEIIYEEYEILEEAEQLVNVE
ncbi:hypothetical protein PVAND_016851 [Polypedilum vanderplanki]|uniref:C2H2-type domain-containing protein n=1 Tax=Polypedilum vanderplanki TaxID=319348 RepID=A0A9J6BGD5_POLVA|nr:hypothetical protein PVAND_016851 [Polypedilum vanderplanki]